MYKALYRLFGGFVADVVAALDQVHNCICRCFISNVLLHDIIFMSKMSCTIFGSSTPDEEL